MIGDAPSGPRAVLLAGLLVLASATAGCSFIAGDDQQPPSPDQVEERLDSLRTIEATMVTSANLSTGPTESRIEMIARPRTGEFRAEVVRPASQNGTVIVSNGSTMYLYNRSANRVSVIDVEGLSSLRNGTFESIVDVFEGIHAESDDADTPSSISSLPVVPVGAGTGTSVSSLPLYGNVTFTYEGTGTVDGREAYVVRAVPQSEDPLVRNFTIWLDQEWYYPLKETGQITIDGTNQSVSMAYRNLTFNPDVPEGTFEFEPPENATVVDSSDRSFESFESRADLAAATNRSLPEPDVPPGYTFESGSRITNPDGEQFSVRYAKGETYLTIMVQPGGSDTGSQTGESVTVDGREATVSSVAGNRVLTMPCTNVTYTVMGSESRDVLVDVAASLDCE